MGRFSNVYSLRAVSILEPSSSMAPYPKAGQRDASMEGGVERWFHGNGYLAEGPFQDEVSKLIDELEERFWQKKPPAVEQKKQR